MTVVCSRDVDNACARVLVVDDHRLLAEGLILALTEDGFSAALASCESNACILDDARQFKPDLVILDLRLGQAGDGLDLIGPLVSLGAEVIVLSGVIDGAVLAACLEAGAVGVARKGEGFDSILEKVRAVLAGNTVMSRTESAQLRAALHAQRLTERSKREPFESLTKREAEVLRQIINGIPAEEIARIQFVSVPTVRSQIRSILRKLGVNSQLAAAALASAAGWPDSYGTGQVGQA